MKTRNCLLKKWVKWWICKFTVETLDEKKEVVAFNQFAIFVVGAGNFGGVRSSPAMKQPMNPPSRAPDASVSEKTSVDQV